MQLLSSNGFATTRKGIVPSMLEWEFNLLGYILWVFDITNIARHDLVRSDGPLCMEKYP